MQPSEGVISKEIPIKSKKNTRETKETQEKTDAAVEKKPQPATDPLQADVSRMKENTLNNIPPIDLNSQRQPQQPSASSKKEEQKTSPAKEEKPEKTKEKTKEQKTKDSKRPQNQSPHASSSDRANTPNGLKSTLTTPSKPETLHTELLNQLNLPDLSIDAANMPTVNDPGQQYHDAVLNLRPDQMEEHVKKDPFMFIREMLNRLFNRFITFPVKGQTLRSFLAQNRTVVDQSLLVGEFYNSADEAYWRIVGMRNERTVGPTIEYDVIRLRSKGGTSGSTAESGTPEDNHQIMKLCDSDNLNQHRLFLQQAAFLNEFHQQFNSNHPLKRRFPGIYGAGAFEQMCYKDISELDESSNHLVMVYPRPSPRPYLLVERTGPSLEEVLRANPFGILDVSTARYLAIGCIQTLRVMHEMGFVHRCVTNYTFGLRLFHGQFLADDPLFESVVCRDVTFCRPFRDHPPRRVSPFVGTLKYSSPSAMDNCEQMPSDDLRSVLYMFCEFVHGKLPWRRCRTAKEIKKMKLDLEKEPPLVVDDTGDKRVPIDLRYLPKAFYSLDAFNPFVAAEYTVYRDLCTILNLVAEANRHMLTEEYLAFDKWKRVTEPKAKNTVTKTKTK